MGMFLLLGLLVAGGYVLGIVGFFRANNAHTELRLLRRLLAEVAARQGPPVAPVAEPEAARMPSVPAAEPVPPAATQPPPRPTPEPAAAPSGDPSGDLETLLTARWGVWLGSAALLMAGVFLIRYAVERELLGPTARCILAALLGVALLAAAEWLIRYEPPAITGALRTDQAPAGLAAGGTAILFGAAYGAGPFYGLMPPLPAFACLAAASFIALAAALRYGPLTAATGIVGAFATPALVTTDNPSLPGLFAYLIVVSAAALAVVRYTAWIWLGWATTIAGCIWVCIASGYASPDEWAAAAFVPMAAALNLFLLPAAALDHPMGRRLAWVPFAALGAAGLLLETRIAGNAPLIGLFLLSPIAVWRGYTEPRLDRLPWLAALIGLLTLLFWALPAWTATGDTITVEGVVEAFFPGAWAPEIIRPLIISAAGFAAFHAAVGLWMERRARQPLHWAALVSAVPVLTLTVAYAQVARFQGDFRWAMVALALAAALTGNAARAAADAARHRAASHVAGAVAALALGCAMLMHDHWLTLAIALFLPALAWIEARADLPPLRQVALAVAVVVLTRLLLNWYVLQYAFGATPVVNGLIAAYAAPAVAFACAAILFRRRADDLLVATLEAGAATFAAFFVALEIRHGLNSGDLVDKFSFNEIAMHMLTISAQATMYLYLAVRTGRPVFDWAWRLLGSTALSIGAGLLVFNPVLIGSRVTAAGLLAGYLVPAVLAVAARRFVVNAVIGRLLGTYALVAGFAWITLQIRYLFHPDQMRLISGSIQDAEIWAWSGAWLVYGVALMVLGIRANDRWLRLAALAVIGLVCAKVFLIDMSDLTGLWRVLSFLGLGLALIGLAVIHGRFVLPGKPARGATGEAPTS